MKSDKIIEAIREKLLENDDPKFHDLSAKGPELPKPVSRLFEDPIDRMLRRKKKGKFFGGG
jgi:hypothetical protein